MKFDYNTVKSESDVEVKIILPVIENLGFNKHTDVFFRVPVSFFQGRQKITKEADIVVHKDNSPFLVVEAKSTNEKIDDKNIAQLDSYAYGLECRYGILCNGKEILLREYKESNRKVTVYRAKAEEIDYDDFKIFLNSVQVEQVIKDKINQNVSKKQASSFASTLKQIHQTIRNTDKLDPTGAFDGWSKLLFMKIHEEKWTEENKGIVRFNYSKFLENKAVDKHNSFIEDTFKETKEAFPQVFEDQNEKIGLSLDAIEKILEILDGYNILEMPIDVKGKAFEIFLSSTFRGKGLGQFFTPREAVNFMVDFIDFKIDDIVLDPACGTGGFLIGAYHKIFNIISTAPTNYWRQIGQNKEDYIQNIKENNFYGIDAEPRAAKTAKMNMIMWGDGENVYRGNGLSDADFKNTPYAFKENQIDVILANPPFGNKEDDINILTNYELSNKTSKTECLFIEKAIKYLKPSGKLGIVLPDAILGSESMGVIREYIRKNAKILAVISLPKHTFAPSGVATINTSILFLEKYDNEFFANYEGNKNNNQYISNLINRYNEYNIFMGVAQNIGYEPSGKKTKCDNEDNDLDLILRKYQSYDSKTACDDFFEIDKNCFVININQISLQERIDSRYYWFKYTLQKKTFNRVPLKKYIENATEKIDPTEYIGNYFSIISVTNRYGIILDEDNSKKFMVSAEDFNQKYKVVHPGNIVYNPYRMNVGSIGIVDEEFDNMLVSPAYVVFKTKNGLTPKFLLSVLKHPFYQLYIDVLATGSVRNNFSYKYLEQIEIPSYFIDNNTDTVENRFDEIDTLNKSLKIVKENLVKEVEKMLG